MNYSNEIYLNLLYLKTNARSIATMMQTMRGNDIYKFTNTTNL